MHLISFFHKPATFIIRKIFKLFRIPTLGVHAIVINSEKQILLVKHTYKKGWHLPGGALKYGETLSEAMKRELQEETGVIANKVEFFNVYYHTIFGAINYPAVFIVEDFILTDKKPCIEITEIKWFAYENLPNDITNGTQRRLDEYFLGQHKTEFW